MLRVLTRKALVCLSIFAFISLGITPLHAAPGDLDTTFNGTGWNFGGFGRGSDYPAGIAIQPDGKIVSGGWVWDGNDHKMAVARTNADGTPDLAFGDRGRAIARFPGRWYTQAVALQSDGKILAVGYLQSSVWTVIRFNSDGSIDETYGNGGRASTDMSGSPYAAALQSDGKLVVVGGTSANVFNVVRLNSDGSYDTSFDGDGKLTTSFPSSSGSWSQAVTIQSDGKILVAGSVRDAVTNRSDFAVARYNPSGSLDTSFDGDGIAITPVLSLDDLAYSILCQPDGKIVVAGSAWSSTWDDFAVVRYNSNGSLDTSFDGDGKATVNFIATGSTDIARSLLLQSDGKLVLSGTSYDGNSSFRDFAFARLNINGSLDTTFDGDGRATISIGNRDELFDAELQSDGSIVALGQVDQSDFGLVRLWANGLPDTNFDLDGRLQLDVGNAQTYSNDIVIQSDGKAVIVGTAPDGYNSFAIQRFNTDGTLDEDFGNDGKVQTKILQQTHGEAIAIQPDGKIVVAGYAQLLSGHWDFAVARYNPDGTLDTTFDADGTVNTDIGTSSQDNAYAVAITSDSKIYVAGTTASQQVTVVRYNSDGTLDGSFDSDGKATYPVTSAQVSTLAMQDDGKLLVAGGRASGTWDFLAMRINADGSLDTAFDGDGIVTTPILASGDVAADLAIQSDGKIVLAGYAQGATSSLDFAVARYNPNGSLDTSFDGDGKRADNFTGSSYDRPTSVDISPSGRIIVTGVSQASPATGITQMVYLSNGSLDMNFDGDGIKFIDQIGQWSVNQPGAAAMDSNQRIVVAGTRDGLQAVARLQAVLSPTSAPVTVSGRVVDSRGRGLAGVQVTLADDSGGMKVATTNTFGQFKFGNIMAGSTAILKVASRRYTFQPDSQVLSISDSVSDVVFSAR